MADADRAPVPWAAVLLGCALLQFGALRPLDELPRPVAVAATVVVWVATAAGLAVLATRPALRSWLAGRPVAQVLAGGLVAAVALAGVVAYPVLDGRRDTGGGSDADDAVLIVVDGIKRGDDPYEADTYLGNPPSTGPGVALWFLPFSTRTLYPFGIVAAIGVTLLVLRASHGGWGEAGLVALLLGASLPFWEGVAQGSDHLVFSSSLVWAVCALRPRARPVPPWLTVVAAVVVGVLATSRAAFAFVPLVAAAGVWWRDRRTALVFGGVGTAVVLLLHGAFVARSGWDGYDPVQQILDKSGEDLDRLGELVVVAGVVASLTLVVRELRRRADARVDVLLLVSVAGPMTAIAVAGLLAPGGITNWSAGNYLLDAVVLAAYWFVLHHAPVPVDAPGPPAGVPS